MARSSSRGRSRGQLVLVAGLGIAVTLVLLAVILNTVIFTQNLATREGVSGRDPVGFASGAERGTGGLVTAVNYWNATEYGALVDQLHRGVETWAGNASLLGVTHGEVTDVRLLGTTNGTRILQAANASWTNASDAADWTMATDVTGTRRFRMNVSRNGLFQPASALAAAELAGSAAFRVNVTDGTDTWGLYVYRNASDASKVTVRTLRPDGTATTCTVQASYVAVDATQGTVAGTTCEFTWAAGVGAPYSVRVANGDNVAARYVLFVDRPRTPLLTDLPNNTYHDQAADESPFTAAAIYSARVNVTFRRPDVQYATILTVAPERVPGGETFSIAPLGGRELVFVSAASGHLSTIGPDGNVTVYDATGVEAIGPMQVNFDDDDRLEIPYVNASGAVKLIDAANETQTLATHGAATQKSILGVGTWHGDTAVFYPNASAGDTIYMASPTIPPTEVQVGGNAVQASGVAGVADYNMDGDTDIVYLDTSQNVYYVDGDTTIEVGRNVGQNLGIGAGALRDADRDGENRLPIVSGSNNVGLLDETNSFAELTTGGSAEKAPVALYDVTGGPAMELVYVHASSDTLYYVTLDGSIEQLTDENGDPISPVQEAGVA